MQRQQLCACRKWRSIGLAVARLASGPLRGGARWKRHSWQLVEEEEATAHLRQTDMVRRYRTIPPLGVLPCKHMTPIRQLHPCSAAAIMTGKARRRRGGSQTSLPALISDAVSFLLDDAFLHAVRSLGV